MLVSLRRRFAHWHWCHLSTQWPNAYLHQCRWRLIWCRDCGSLVKDGAHRTWCSRNANAPARGGARFRPSAANPHGDGHGRPSQTARAASSFPSPTQTKPPQSHTLPIPLHHLLAIPFCPVSITTLHQFSLSAFRLFPLSQAFPYSFPTPPAQDRAGILCPAQPWQSGTYFLPYTLKTDGS